MEENLTSPLDLLSEDLKDPKGVPVLTLAFIGDAVYEVLARSLVLDRQRRVSKLHQEAASIVKAQAQATKARDLGDFLTEEEEDILRRGRNAHPKTRAKNADVKDYRLATGLEALFGYLYLKGDRQRILDIFQRMWM